MKILSNCDCKVEGVEKVDIKIEENMIKYFHAKDNELVEELVQLIYEKTGIKLIIVYNSKYAYKVDSKYFEIWLK